MSKVKLSVWSPSSESLGEILSFPSSSFWWLLAFLDLLAYDYVIPISASIFTSPFPLSLWVFLSVSYKDDCLGPTQMMQGDVISTTLT